MKQTYDETTLSAFIDGELDTTTMHEVDLLLEKETVLGKELDELIQSLRPGIELPSKNIDDTEPEPQATSEST